MNDITTKKSKKKFHQQKHPSTPIIIITEKTEPFSLPPPQDFSEKKTKQIY